MQQPVIEEGAAVVSYEPISADGVRSYDDLFPALPESTLPTSNAATQRGQWNNKMRFGSSVVTQVFRYFCNFMNTSKRNNLFNFCFCVECRLRSESWTTASASGRESR